MLLDKNVASLRHEVGVPLTAPASLCEGLPRLDSALAWIGIKPAVAIARLPSAMRNKENPDARRSRCRQDGAQIVEKADFTRDIFHHRPELSALRQEVI